MIEKVTSRLFLMCLVSCASLVLFLIWSGGPDNEVYFKIAATFFIIGLGSFLSWLVTFYYNLRNILCA